MKNTNKLLKNSSAMPLLPRIRSIIGFDVDQVSSTTLFKKNVIADGLVLILAVCVLLLYSFIIVIRESHQTDESYHNTREVIITNAKNVVE